MLFFRTLIALLLTSLLLGAVCSAQVITTPKLDTQLVATDSYSEVVPVGTSRQIAFTADPSANGGDVFHVVSSISNATVSLFLPNGTEITSTNAAAQGFDYVTVQNDDNTGRIMPSLFASRGTHTVIRIPASSVAGTYSIKVVAPAGPEDTVVIASYLSSSEVRAGLVPSSQWFRIGETVVLSALVFNGETPITNATVTAAVDDSFEDTIPPVNITLQDSGTRDFATGDGIYTGTFTPTRAGEYAAAVRVTGTSSSVNFKRLAGTTFRVQEPLATFVTFSDAGVDDDSDGLFDRIVVSSNLSVQRAGSYQFSLSLVASNGEIVKSESSAVLSTGSQQMSASFSAATILGLGVNGPYSIQDAMLTFHSDPTVLVADHRANAGNTAAYTLSSLDRPALFFTANRTAVGLDTNANGKYDLLRVRAELLALEAGFYQWSGVLADPAGNEIAFVASEGNFVAGSNFITLDFSGSLIGQHGVNGPYSVRSIIVFGVGESIIVDRLFDTQAFSFKEFENSDNIRLGTVTAQETSGDGDTFIEPGENGSLSVQLSNVGGTTISGVTATLSSSTPGVTITSAQSTYSSLAPSGSATNSSPFIFTLSNEVPCAEAVMFKLTINHNGDGGIPSVVNFSIQPGQPTAAATFNYTGAPVAIPDNQVTGVNIPITVSGFSGILKDLNFRFDGSVCTATAGATTVGLDHTFVGDLVITLTSPSGTTVRLLSQPGAAGSPSSGNNFCNTVLDDEGGGSSIQNISSSGNPYSGTFIPADSLAAFRGENPNGTWILNVADTIAADTGNVRAFSLLLSGVECASAPPPLLILTDDFNDNNLNTETWKTDDLLTGWSDLNVIVAETAQHLEIGPLLVNTANSYGGVTTWGSYNFTGGFSYVELVQAPSAQTHADAIFTVGNFLGYYRIYVSFGSLIGVKNILGNQTTLFSMPYNAVAHRFLRIRHDSATGNVIFDTAPGNGGLPGTWVQRHSEPWNSTLGFNGFQFEIKAGTLVAEPNAPGTVIFDNFQFGLTAPPP